MGKTNWDKIVSGNDLAKARALRNKTYITSKEREGALDALREEGWEYIKTYADEKFVSVKKINLATNFLRTRFGRYLCEWVSRV